MHNLADAKTPALIPVRPVRRMIGSCLNVLATGLRLFNRLQPLNDERILVVDPVGLGDIITCEPLIRQLLKGSEEIIVCSKQAFKELFPPHPRLRWASLHLPFGSPDEKQKYLLKNYVSDPFRSEIQALKGIAPGATALELRGDIRCVLLLYALGCRRVISLSNYLGSNSHLWSTAVERVPFNHNVKRWELNLQFYSKLKTVPVPKTESPHFDHLIKKVENRRICFMPMAPWPGKLWQKESWQKLGSTFRSEKYEVTVLCGPKQTEATRAEVGPDLPIVECGSMAAWISELNRCSCLISVDSGPMHLADALRVPLVALFGQGKLPLWAPSSKTSRYLHHQDDPDFQICQPIFKNIPLGREFMNRITTSEVLRAAREVMADSLTSVQST